MSLTQLRQLLPQSQVRESLPENLFSLTMEVCVLEGSLVRHQHLRQKLSFTERGVVEKLYKSDLCAKSIFECALLTKNAMYGDQISQYLECGCSFYEALGIANLK